MSDKLSFHICSQKEEEPVSTLASDMQNIVFAAADPLLPGEIVKARMRRAWAALNYPPFWRIKAAWYGEAEAWGGKAVKDFERRDATRRQKEEAARGNANHAVTALVALRGQYLAAPDADFHREQVVAIDAALAAMGFGHGSMDGAEGQGEGRP